jgi:Ca-activated chloride channel homolog
VSPLTSLLPLLLAQALAASPFTAEQPRVREGNEKLLSGDPAGALERLDAAEQEVGTHPEIDYDRGEALYALGRHAEAREAWKKALDADAAGALSSHALQNMGNALDALGDKAGAVRAFSEALTRDPGNEDARYNLEVLLRRRGEGKGAPKDQGDKGQQKPQGPTQQGQGQRPPEQEQTPGAQGQKPDPKPGEQPQPSQPKDGQAKAGDQGKPPKPKDGPAAGAPGEQQTGRDGRSGQPSDGLAKQDAERLLDALRARERNMPLGPAGRKEARRKDVEKDW